MRQIISGEYMCIAYVHIRVPYDLYIIVQYVYNKPLIRSTSEF